MTAETAWLIVWPVAVPLIAAALATIAWRRPNIQAGIAFAAIALQLVAAIMLFLLVWRDGAFAMTMGNWAPPFGISFVADTLSAGLVALTAFVGAAIAVFGLGDSSRLVREAGFYPLLLALLCAVSGAFLTGDIFNLYVWFEIILIASFGLLILGGRREQLDGAVKYAALNLVATTLFLIATGLLYGLTGTLSMADLSVKVAALDPQGPIAIVAMLYLLAFGMKAAAFPLFFWLPASYHTANAAVSAVFGALLTKVGVYALIRVFTLIFPMGAGGAGEMAGDIMLWVAVATMVIGAFGALAQTDMRRIVSFTVVSGIGVMLLGLALGSALALAGALFYMVHSIVVTAAMFMTGGIAGRMAETTRLPQLAGLYRASPLFALLFILAALSLAGVPPFAGFWPKVVLVQASLEADGFIAAGAVLLTGFLTLAVIGRLWVEAFLRNAPEKHEVEITGLSARVSAPVLFYLPLAALAVLAFAIGLWSGPLFEATARVVGELFDTPLYIEAVFGKGGAP
jgi:multicomponent Na+:H+ antiporter subunit D